MTTDNRSNSANEPATFPRGTQQSGKTEMPEKEVTGKPDRADQIADHLAHKGSKAEQEFDTDNQQPFSK